MNHRTAAVLALSCALFLIACGGDEPHAHHEHAPTKTHTEGGGGGLVLNDGKKWPMDDHTRASLRKMATFFADVDVAELGVEGLKKAGDRLKQDLDALIAGCTMQGPAHDQLHLFLSTYIPAVAALQTSGRVEDARTVQQHLATYAEFFE